MKVLKGAITQLASEGYITLQVPTFTVSFASNYDVEADLEEKPDEWFCYLRFYGGKLGPAKDGFLYLTRAGWEANRDDIKAAFLASSNKRGTWLDFETHVQEHFSGVEATLKKVIAKAQKQIADMKNFTV